MWWVIRRYHPGIILLIGVAMGMGINIPFSFVRPFSEQLGIEGIRGFFLTYAAVAFVVRVTCRRFPDRLGVRKTVTLGMVFLTFEMLSFLWVTNAARLVLPAIFGGIAHAFVFPAAMTGGSLAFPSRYRGLATTLMLTMFDSGTLLGQPAAGTILHFCRQNHLPDYPIMYFSAAGMMLASNRCLLELLATAASQRTGQPTQYAGGSDRKSREIGEPNLTDLQAACSENSWLALRRSGTSRCHTDNPERKPSHAAGGQAATRVEVLNAIVFSRTCSMRTI